MSRQTYFFQTELDMKAFFSVITDLGACIVTNAQEKHQVNDENVFISYMLQRENLAILPLTHYLSYQEVCKTLDTSIPIWSGSYVEFLPCFIRSHNPYKVENGRIYICPNEDSLSYHPEISMLYNKICRYIKKEYAYDEKYFAYMAPDFVSHYLNREIYLW